MNAAWGPPGKSVGIGGGAGAGATFAATATGAAQQNPVRHALLLLDT